LPAHSHEERGAKMPTRQAAGGGTRIDSLVITEAITSSYHGRGLVAMIIPGATPLFE